MASCFVPYDGFEGPAQRTFSLYEQQTSAVFDGGYLGRLLYLFAGVAIATLIAVVGVARSDPQPRVPSLLIGAVAAWSLLWIGVMLSWTRFGISLEVGYWVQAVSIGVVIVGTIVVWHLEGRKRTSRTRPSGEPSFTEPEQWFLATFFGGVVGLAFMLVASIIDWLRGFMFERDDDR